MISVSDDDDNHHHNNEKPGLRLPLMHQLTLFRGCHALQFKKAIPLPMFDFYNRKGLQ